MQEHRQTIFRRMFNGAIVATTLFGLVGLGPALQSASADNGVADQLQSATQVQSLVANVTSNQPNNGSSTESVSGLSDQNVATKWYEGTGNVPSASSPIYAIYTLTSAAKATGYVVTSANDSQERDPSAWTVLGTDSDAAVEDATSSDWVALDAQSGQKFDDRKQAKAYVINTPAAYKYYQLRVTQNYGNTNKFQVADWTLIGQTNDAQNLVENGDWSYWDSTDANDASSDPTHGSSNRTAWTTTSDSDGWKSGTAPFGVKEVNGEEADDLGNGFIAKTMVQRDLKSGGIVPVYFFKRSIRLTADDLKSIGGLLGEIVYDDSATVYVNGTKVAGWNDELATSNTGFLGGYGANDPERQVISIPGSVLKAGNNEIAVEVHQVNQTSSDAYFAMPVLSATSDYLSLPFANATTSEKFSSNAWPATADGSNYYVQLLSGFKTLEDDHPELLGANTTVPNGNDLTALDDKLVVQINNGSSTKQTAKAINDANNSPVDTMYDGLGDRLGKLYTQAKNAGQLPKTLQVLNLVGNGIDQHDAAKNVFQYNRPYDRLGFVKNGGRIMSADIGYGFHNDSFPSGHTTAGYLAGTTLATLLPELGPQMLERASEYGNNRIVLGFHYPTDIMGGRIGSQAMVGYRWSDPTFRSLLSQAHNEIESVLLSKCRAAGYGSTITECANDAATTKSADAVYSQRLTYGFPTIASTTDKLVIPTGAEDLLTTTYPNLTDSQRRQIIEQTALTSGYPFDQSAEGTPSWQRINLAAAMSATFTIDSAGDVHVDTSQPSSNTALASIAVDGKQLGSFSSSVTSYGVELPSTAKTPVVTATAVDAGASVVIGQATSANGTATITVTAADGSIATTTISFAKQAAAEPGSPQRPSLQTSFGPTAIQRYGRAHAVKVIVLSNGKAAQGNVSATWSGKPVGNAVFSNGKATLQLSSAIPAGHRNIRLKVTTRDGGSISQTLTLRVTRAVPTIKAVKRSKGKVLRHSRSGNVVVTMPKSQGLSGTVNVIVNGHVRGHAKLKSTKAGMQANVSVHLKRKDHGKVTVRYTGNANYASKSLKTKIKVK